MYVLLSDSDALSHSMGCFIQPVSRLFAKTLLCQQDGFDEMQDVFDEIQDGFDKMQDGFSKMYHLCLQGRKEIISQMVEASKEETKEESKGKDLINDPLSIHSGCTPLMVACLGGQFDLAKEMIKVWKACTWAKDAVSCEVIRFLL